MDALVTITIVGLALGHLDGVNLAGIHLDGVNLIEILRSSCGSTELG